jgi:hypothetical protein
MLEEYNDPVVEDDRVIIEGGGLQEEKGLEIGEDAQVGELEENKGHVLEEDINQLR